MKTSYEFGFAIYFIIGSVLQFSEKAPLILWLQGGPGGSSLFGFFIEHGPFYVTDQLELKKRSTAWSLPYNVLYIDQPVGTGFSYTKNDLGYATNQEMVANDLYEAMKQFYTMFPDLLSEDFYVTGESYAGKETHLKKITKGMFNNLPFLFSN